MNYHLETSYRLDEIANEIMTKTVLAQIKVEAELQELDQDYIIVFIEDRYISWKLLDILTTPDGW